MNITETYTVAVISTAHLAEDDRVVLQRPIGKTSWITPTRHGWLLRLYILDDGTELADLLRQEGLSPGLCRNLLMLADAGYALVDVDEDGQIIRELERLGG